jgi:hypothetical protein
MQVAIPLQSVFAARTQSTYVASAVWQSVEQVKVPAPHATSAAQV